MKRNYLYLVLGLAASAAVSWKSCRNNAAPQNENAAVSQKTKNRHDSQPLPSRTQEIRDSFKHADTPIDFFGRVIDQEGNGVGGVTINYLVQKAGNYLDSGIVQNTDEKKQCLTEADGRFEIKGVNGLTLGIGPLEKAGYRDGSRNARSFGLKGTPEIHQADPQKAVDFLLIRADVSKTKEIYDKRLGFSWNQGEVRIHLDDKLGDFVLTPTRKWEAGQLRDFDWNIKVRMENAGLALLDNEAAEIAPMEGYQSSFEYGALKGDQKWYGGVQARYAFKTSQGIYGIIGFNLYAEREDNKVNGSLNVRLNESGARNLD